MEDLSLSEGVIKTILNAAPGKQPNFPEGSKVTFHFQTFIVGENNEAKEIPLDDSKKIGKPMELILGKQFKMPVWESCLKTMKIHEISKFAVKKNLVDAYPLVSKSYREFSGVSSGVKKGGHCCGMMAFAGGVGHSDLDCLTREPRDLHFTLELLQVEHPGEFKKETWTMNPEEKLQSVPQLKEVGNELYRRKQYEEAAKQYAEALGMLEQLLLREKPGDVEWLELEKMKFPILSNYAQCKLLLKDYYPVIEYTTTILEKDKDNVKALYRRAKAYVGTWDLEAAKEDLTRLANLDTQSGATVRKELANIANLQKQKDDEMRNKLLGKV